MDFDGEKRAISFCSCKKKWQKKKHVQGGHAIVSPLKIPPLGGKGDPGGASRRFYCPVLCLTGLSAAAAMRRLVTPACCG